MASPSFAHIQQNPLRTFHAHSRLWPQAETCMGWDPISIPSVLKLIIVVGTLY